MLNSLINSLFTAWSWVTAAAASLLYWHMIPPCAGLEEKCQLDFKFSLGRSLRCSINEPPTSVDVPQIQTWGKTTARGSRCGPLSVFKSGPPNLSKFYNWFILSSYFGLFPAPPEAFLAFDLIYMWFTYVQTPPPLSSVRNNCAHACIKGCCLTQSYIYITTKACDVSQSKQGTRVHLRYRRRCSSLKSLSQKRAAVIGHFPLKASCCTWATSVPLMQPEKRVCADVGLIQRPREIVTQRDVRWLRRSPVCCTAGRRRLTGGS